MAGGKRDSAEDIVRKLRRADELDAEELPGVGELIQRRQGCAWFVTKVRVVQLRPAVEGWAERISPRCCRRRQRASG